MTIEAAGEEVNDWTVVEVDDNAVGVVAGPLDGTTLPLVWAFEASSLTELLPVPSSAGSKFRIPSSLHQSVPPSPGIGLFAPKTLSQLLVGSGNTTSRM